MVSDSTKMIQPDADPMACDPKSQAVVSEPTLLVPDPTYLVCDPGIITSLLETSARSPTLFLPPEFVQGWAKRTRESRQVRARQEFLLQSPGRGFAPHPSSTFNKMFVDERFLCVLKRMQKTSGLASLRSRAGLGIVGNSDLP